MANEKKKNYEEILSLLVTREWYPSIQNNYFSFRNTYKTRHQIKKIFYQILNSKRITHVHALSRYKNVFKNRKTSTIIEFHNRRFRVKFISIFIIYIESPM